jgi:hypothetical protein
MDTTNDEYNAKRANAEDYTDTRTEGFKTDYDKAIDDVSTAPTMTDAYEKIANPKFSEYIKRDFDLIVDADEVFRKQKRLINLRRQIQPSKENIRDLEMIVNQYEKILSKVGFHEEKDQDLLSTLNGKYKQVPNHADELLLVTITGMTVEELQNRLSGLNNRLNGLIAKQARLQTEIVELEAFLEIDYIANYINLCMADQPSGDILAVKYIFDDGSQITKIVVGVVINAQGEKLLESVDFVSGQDDFDEELAMNRLIFKFADYLDPDCCDRNCGNDSEEHKCGGNCHDCDAGC